MRSKKFPVLKCFPTRNGQVKAWCPYCLKWHLHGYDGAVKSGIIGHWVSNCTVKESPFNVTGYELKFMTKAEIKEISSAIELYP